MKSLTLFIAALSISFVGCKSTKTTVQEEEVISESRSDRDKSRQGGRERLSPDQMLAQFDTNKDGRLSKSEVKGPLTDNFDTIDTNNDGYLTLEEIKNAPKPERRQRGQRRQ